MSRITDSKKSDDKDDNEIPSTCDFCCAAGELIGDYEACDSPCPVAGE